MQILLTIAYDGTKYAGWQRQANAGTVQQVIEETLARVFQRKIAVTGASRTDAGVHALGQAASFYVDACKIPLDKIPYVMNSYLPPDIAVTRAQGAPEGFNPRFDAKEKIYQYLLWHDRFPNPLLRHTSVFFPYALDVDRMKEAAVRFVGRHDFAAFCAAGSSAKTTIREIYECRLEAAGPLITLTIRGSGFLYNMVRIIMGTLLYAGQGRIVPEEVPAIMASRDRTKAGKTAPPQGLTLLEIRY